MTDAYDAFQTLTERYQEQKMKLISKEKEIEDYDGDIEGVEKLLKEILKLELTVTSLHKYLYGITLTKYEITRYR